MNLGNRAIQVAIGVILTFAVLYQVLPYNLLKLYLDAARVGVWAVVWFITIHVAYISFISRDKRQGMVVAISINLVALMITIQGVWIPVNRELGKHFPIWVPELISPLVVVGFIVSGVFFLLPIGNTIGITPPRNWWFLLAAGIVGALVAGIMIGIGIQAPPV